jgi:hypothetical protein
MWSYKLFRIGALILAGSGVLHLLGFIGAKSTDIPLGLESQLHELMYNYKSNVMGTMRSKGDLHDGLSLAFMVFLLTLAAFGFTLPVNRKNAMVIAGSLAATLVISLVYWYSLPSASLAMGLAFYAGAAYLEKQ